MWQIRQIISEREAYRPRAVDHEPLRLRLKSPTSSLLLGGRVQRQGQVHRGSISLSVPSLARVPSRSCVPVQRAGAAPAEGRPSNSRGGTMTWRGGAESRPRGERHHRGTYKLHRSPVARDRDHKPSWHTAFPRADSREWTRTHAVAAAPSGRQLQDGNAQALGVSAWPSLMYAQKTLCRCTFLTLNSAHRVSGVMLCERTE